jgi:hypothetical protein
MEKSILFSYIKDPGIGGGFGQQKDSGISIRCGRPMQIAIDSQ